jgi:AraC-like DNA-binding protein
MIHNGFGWGKKACMKLASLKPLPREAMEVARLIEDTRASGLTLAQSMKQWIRDLSLRENGLTDKAVDVLVCLADQRPTGLSLKNICAQLAVSPEEFQRQLMPQLLRNMFHPSYISVSGRHKITEDGLNELRRRGYPY